jgi:Tfp pilus assembly protein FimT
MQLPWHGTTEDRERDGLTWTELLVVYVVFAVIVIIAISTQVS